MTRLSAILLTILYSSLKFQFFQDRHFLLCCYSYLGASSWLLFSRSPTWSGKLHSVPTMFLRSGFLNTWSLPSSFPLSCLCGFTGRMCGLIEMNQARYWPFIVQGLFNCRCRTSRTEHSAGRPVCPALLLVSYLPIATAQLLFRLEKVVPLFGEKLFRVNNRSACLLT